MAFKRGDTNTSAVQIVVNAPVCTTARLRCSRSALVRRVGEVRVGPGDLVATMAVSRKRRALAGGMQGS